MRTLAASILLACFIIASFPDFALAATQGALQVEVSSVVNDSKESGAIVVELVNTGTDPARDVEFEVWDGNQKEASTSVGRLAGLQSMVVRFQVQSLSSPYGILEYSTSNGRNSEVIPFLRNTSPSSIASSNLVAVLVSSSIAIIGVLAGAISTHVATARRERKQREYDVRKGYVERYGAAYRSFLTNWNMSLSSSRLETEFANLSGAAYLPPDAAVVYMEVMTIIASSANKSEKEVAVRRLFERIMKLADRGE